MGCDIHAHVEVKVDGKWHHYNAPRIERNYKLFSKMAGVRAYDDTVKPIAPQRGLPSRLSFTTRYDAKHYGSDGHSHSWLKSEEVAELCDWMEAEEKKLNPKHFYYAEKELGYVFGNGWDFKKYQKDGVLEGMPKGFEDARLVFWFDN